MMQEVTILIHDYHDIIAARMQVREAARHYGMSLTDQACISMATSSLANNLFKRDHHKIEGCISIKRLTKASKIGLRVQCVWKGMGNCEIPYGNEHWMVDTIESRKTEEGHLEVVLTKWAKQPLDPLP